MIKEKHREISVVGFADDTNLLAFGKHASSNCKQLEKAWTTCLQWAETHGMEFNGSKSELIHFNKGRAQWTDPVQLANPAGQGSGSGTVSPSPNARFLGVWLDWRLNWKAYEAKVVNKLKTQNYALSKIAAKT